MNVQTSPSSKTPPDDAQPCGGEVASSRADRRLCVLDRLTEVGMEIVEEIRLQVKQGPPPCDGPQAQDKRAAFYSHFVLAHDRMARSVRLTLTLQERFEAGPQKRKDSGGGGTLEDYLDELDREEAGQKTRIAGIVEQIAKAEHADAETVDRLVRDAADRLDREADGDPLVLPISEIVDRLCRNLNLSPDWSQLAKQAWAREEIDSGVVGDPLKPFIVDQWERALAQAAGPPISHRHPRNRGDP